MNKVSFGIIILLAIANMATAQTLNFTAKNWRSFTIKQGGNQVCYIASVPVRESGTFKKRSAAFVMVTHRGANIDEVSVSSGYYYKQLSELDLNINGKITKLFTKDERAWAKDAATDAALVKAMMNGHSMSAKGISKLDTTSNDSYSLAGFTAAYNKMKETCN
jgi:invasion protein IalB